MQDLELQYLQLQTELQRLQIKCDYLKPRLKHPLFQYLYTFLPLEIIDLCESYKTIGFCLECLQQWPNLLEECFFHPKMKNIKTINLNGTVYFNNLYIHFDNANDEKCYNYFIDNTISNEILYSPRAIFSETGVIMKINVFNNFFQIEFYTSKGVLRFRVQFV